MARRDLGESREDAFERLLFTYLGSVDDHGVLDPARLPKLSVDEVALFNRAMRRLLRSADTRSPGPLGRREVGRARGTDRSVPPRRAGSGPRRRPRRVDRPVARSLDETLALGSACWHCCADPLAILSWVEGWVSDRKLLLLGVTCARRVRRVLPDPRSRAALDVAERGADGLATPSQWRQAVHGAQYATARARAATWARIPQDGSPEPLGSEGLSVRLQSWAQGDRDCVGPRSRTDLEWTMAGAVEGLVRSRGGSDLDCAAYLIVSAVLDVASSERGGRDNRDWAEAVALAVLVRDVIGDPFRPVAFPPAWAAAKGGRAGQLARIIYDQRRFDYLPLLADLLQEAGYEEKSVLAHCLAAQEHTRGCWVVDGILGRD